MFECINCGCTYSELISKPPHVGIYCKSCGKWNGWAKHSTSTKTKEEYKNEYLDKQEATETQVFYIKNLLRQTKLSKFKACEIIKLLGGEV